MNGLTSSHFNFLCRHVLQPVLVRARLAAGTGADMMIMDDFDKIYLHRQGKSRELSREAAQPSAKVTSRKETVEFSLMCTCSFAPRDI